MGISFSCPVAEFDEFESRFESSRSVSFNGRDSEPTTKMKSFNSAKMIFEGSLSFNGRELETTISFKASPSSDKDGNGLFVKQVSFKRTIGDQMARFGSLSEEKPKSTVPESGNHRYQAALKLQKVYKSFRTRRQLADCAVLVEQRWWKVLDFAELKRSSISFFDIEKPETAVSRWARARTRAAKVGKGLSKDEKARKLALQHWLEAIDPRHRYGHNLQFYYLKWLHCDSKQPFFYWLDIGEGKEVTSDRCPRSKLQQQCIKYLGPAERKAYEVLVDNGRFIYKQSGELLDTRGGPPDVKWIFVLSVSKTLYVGQKSKGTFQHSSFLAGGATLSAGRLVVEDGILKAVWPHSGHYLPTEENFQEFLSLLKENNVDLTNVQKSPTEEGEEGLNFKKQSGIGLPYNPSEADLSQYREEVDAQKMPQNTTDSPNQDSNAAKENHKAPLSRLSKRLCSKITRLEIPKRNDPVFLDMFKKEEVHQDSPTDDGYETAEESFLSEEDFIFPKQNLFEEDEEDENETPISKEQILSRIISHRGLRSYQLAHQLSSKWTTGAGPRIGCMRDYPSELRFRVLEQQNLSPRGKNTHISPKVLTSTRLCRVTNCSTKCPPTPEQVMLSKLATP